ncbi:MAG TPA: hypothetical protein VJ208_04135 [Candidatus Nanoarchaeia archaeon]|nr:hypothetical protein [Candidatus Nanoarchaeia archaeon]
MKNYTQTISSDDLTGICYSLNGPNDSFFPSSGFHKDLYDFRRAKEEEFFWKEADHSSQLVRMFKISRN